MVNAPKKPTMKKSFIVGDKMFFSEERDHKKPIRRHPERFTTSVPHAKLSPSRLWTKEETRKRHTVPIAPPTMSKISLNHIDEKVLSQVSGS